VPFGGKAVNPIYRYKSLLTRGIEVQLMTLTGPRDGVILDVFTMTSSFLEIGIIYDFVDFVRWSSSIDSSV
jgi:hypothetical protein